MERYERLWERLLTMLGALGEVEEQPVRLVLTIDGRRLEVVMTEGEWGDLVSIPYGSFASAAAHVIGTVTSALGQDVPYLVYRDYDLHPSDVPVLPDEFAELKRSVDEARRANPDARFGWFAYPPEQDESH